MCRRRAEVQDVLVAAYYPEVVRSPIVARETAQRAFGVVTAISGALVALGALVKLPERSDLVVGLGIGALGGWMIASLLFMQAMGSRAFERSSIPQDKAEWARLALKESIASRNKLYRWLIAARVVTLLATIATVAVLIAAVNEVRASRTERAVVRLSAHAQATLAPLCPRGSKRLHGRVNVASLRSRLIQLKPDGGQCSKRVSNLRLQSEDVTSVARRSGGR